MQAVSAERTVRLSALTNHWQLHPHCEHEWVVVACPEAQGVVQGRKLNGATAGEPVSGGPAAPVVREA